MPFCACLQKDSILSVFKNNSQSDSIFVTNCFLLSDEYLNENKVDSALFYLSKGISVADNSEMQLLIGKLLNFRGYIQLFFKKDYGKAVVDYVNALKIFDRYNDQQRIMEVQMHLGISNYHLKNYHEALKNLLIAESLALKSNNRSELGIIYSNKGSTLQKIDKINEALVVFEKAQVIFNELGDELNYARSKFNYLSTLIDEDLYNDFKIIDEYYALCLVFEKHQELRSLITCYIHLGIEHKKLKKFNESIAYLNKAEKLAIEINEPELLVDIYTQLYHTHEVNLDIENAFTYLKKHNEMHDSLYQVSQSSVIAELQTQYETEKKENENILLKKNAEIRNKELLIKDQDLNNEKHSKYLLFGGLFLSLIMGISIYYRFRSARNKNKIIRTQKTELEEVNKEVMDSIKYAQRIQDAMLKSNKYIGNNIPSHFLFYKPKNVVSGDFYWYAEKKGFLYLAVADCTGHGVPGAMLSMLGISFLNEIHSTSTIYSCAQVLDQLKVKVVNELNENTDNERMHDGMDVSLIRMDLSTGKINWAGANNSLFILENGNINEILADRQPIGYTENIHPFTDHYFSPSKEAIYYLFTDGFIDQFGGKNRKKLKVKRFKGKLLEYSHLDFDVQLNKLNCFFTEWKGDLNQLDDVTVVGIHSPLKMNLSIREKYMLN